MLQICLKIIQRVSYYWNVLSHYTMHFPIVLKGFDLNTLPDFLIPLSKSTLGSFCCNYKVFVLITILLTICKILFNILTNLIIPCTVQKDYFCAFCYS